jgi:hypothetical protein
MPHRPIAAVSDESGGCKAKPGANLPGHFGNAFVITHMAGLPARGRDEEVRQADQPEGDQCERETAERGDACARPKRPGRGPSQRTPERKRDRSERRQQENEIDNRERLKGVSREPLDRSQPLAELDHENVDAVPVDGEHDHEQGYTSKTGDQLAACQVPKVEDQSSSFQRGVTRSGEEIADGEIARGKTSGAAVDTEGAHGWTFRDGKVIRLVLYSSRRAAL